MRKLFTFFLFIIFVITITTSAQCSDSDYMDAIDGQFSSFKVPIVEDKKHPPVALDMEQVDQNYPSLLEKMERERPPEFNPEKRHLKILAIDGGGIRGILPLVFLSALEKRTGKRTYELFDVIGGTSTGGMIALGLSVKSAQEILDLYTKESDTIFQRNRGLGPKYKATAKRRIFKEFFGDLHLNQARVPTVVTAYELERRRAYHLSSVTPNTHIFDHERLDILMREAALATGAAPIYFEPEVVYPYKENGKRSTTKYTFIDGGVFANNPAMKALIYGMALYPDVSRHNISMLSLGTGYENRNIDASRSHKWGVLNWMVHLIRIFLDGPSKSADTDLIDLLGENFDRVTTVLKHADGHLDRAGDNIAKLIMDGEDMLKRQSSIFEKWVRITTEDEL